jgi:hypothetical protein
LYRLCENFYGGGVCCECFAGGTVVAVTAAITVANVGLLRQVGLLWLRRAEPKMARPFKVAWPIPLIFVLVAAFVCGVLLWQSTWECAVSFGVLLAGDCDEIFPVFVFSQAPFFTESSMKRHQFKLGNPAIGYRHRPRVTCALCLAVWQCQFAMIAYLFLSLPEGGASSSFQWDSPSPRFDLC